MYDSHEEYLRRWHMHRSRKKTSRKSLKNRGLELGAPAINSASQKHGSVANYELYWNKAQHRTWRHAQKYLMGSHPMRWVHRRSVPTALSIHPCVSILTCCSSSQGKWIMKYFIWNLNDSEMNSLLFFIILFDRGQCTTIIVPNVRFLVPVFIITCDSILNQLRSMRLSTFLSFRKDSIQHRLDIWSRTRSNSAALNTRPFPAPIETDSITQRYRGRKHTSL